MKYNNRLIYEEKQLLGLCKMCAWKCRFLQGTLSSSIPPVLDKTLILPIGNSLIINTTFLKGYIESKTKNLPPNVFT